MVSAQGICNRMPGPGAARKRDYVILDGVDPSNVPAFLRVGEQTVPVRQEQGGVMARGLDLSGGDCTGVLVFAEGSEESVDISVQQVC